MNKIIKFVAILALGGVAHARLAAMAPTVHGVAIGDTIPIAEKAVGFRLSHDLKTYPNGKFWDGRAGEQYLEVELNDEGRIKSLEYRQYVSNFPIDDHNAISKVLDKASEKYGVPSFRSSENATWTSAKDAALSWSLKVEPDRIAVGPDKYAVAVVTTLRGYVPPTPGRKANQDRMRAAAVGEVKFQ